MSTRKGKEGPKVRTPRSKVRGREQAALRLIFFQHEDTKVTKEAERSFFFFFFFFFVFVFFVPSR